MTFGEGPSDGDALVYDAATRKWKPGAGGGGGGSSSVLLATKALNDAEIRALPSTGFPGFELVPPAGAGKTLVFLHAILQTKGFKTHPYANVDPDGVMAIRGTAGIGVTTDVFNMSSPPKTWLTTFFDQSAYESDTSADLWVLIPSFIYDLDWGGPVPQSLGSLTSDPDPGFCLGLNSGLGDLTGGDPSNSLTVTITYYELDLVT